MKLNKNLVERLKKSLSALLIFVLLFGQTFHIPLLEVSKAAEEVFPNLVAVVIDAKTHSDGDVEDRLDRYAKDIQSALPGTRVSIIEVPEGVTPEKVAAMLEKLFYDGDGNGFSRLVGTVLVGDISIPVVHQGEKTFLSIFPYVDFVDKAFLYKADKGYFERSESPETSDTPEIWHGVIKPNTGDNEKDLQKIVQFFDKTHEFYSKSGVFEDSKFRIQPHVFYFDSYHDQLSSRPTEWKGYQMMLENIEEVAYKRYSKHLAKTLNDKFQKILGNEGGDEIGKGGTELDALFNLHSNKNTLDLSNSPDIQTKQIVDKLLKNFFEVIGEKYVGDTQRFVHNAGRYGIGNDVKVDIPAAVVSKQDEVMKRTLRDANTVIENSIDTFVRWGLSRGIGVGAVYEFLDHTSTTSSSAGSDSAPASSSTSTNNKDRTYRNYLFGKKGETLLEPYQCSIVRGSTLPVEANRGFNFNLAKDDAELLQADLPRGRCFAGAQAQTQAFWGGNSPLNIDVASIGGAGSKMKLKTHRYNTFVKPIFDIGGSNEIVPGGELPIQSYKDCVREHAWIADPYLDQDAEGYFRTTGFPSERPGQPYACTTDLYPEVVSLRSFDDYMKNGFPNESCTIHNLYLDGTLVKTSGGFCSGILGTGSSGGDSSSSDIEITKNYRFKKIPSVIEHKSPTDQEYGEEIKNFMTPSLPADRDRYIDFLSIKGNYTKINYPNFFRLKWGDGEEVTVEMAKEAITNLLNGKTGELNALVEAQQLFTAEAEKTKVTSAVSAVESGTFAKIGAVSDFSERMKGVLKVRLKTKNDAVAGVVNGSSTSGYTPGSYEDFANVVKNSFFDKKAESEALVKSESDSYALSAYPEIVSKFETKFLSKIDTAARDEIVKSEAARKTYDTALKTAVSDIRSAFSKRTGDLTDLNNRNALSFTGVTAANVDLENNTVYPAIATAGTDATGAKSAYSTSIGANATELFGKIDAALADYKTEIAAEVHLPETEKTKLVTTLTNAVTSLKTKTADRNGRLSQNSGDALTEYQTFSDGIKNQLPGQRSRFATEFSKWPVRCTGVAPNVVCTGYSDATMKSVFTSILSDIATDSATRTNAADTEIATLLTSAFTETSGLIGNLDLPSLRTAVKAQLDVSMIFSEKRKAAYVAALQNGITESLEAVEKNAPVSAIVFDSTKTAAAIAKPNDLAAIVNSNPLLLQALAEAVVWNNTQSATSKYAFILDRYLDIDGNSSVPVIGHKSDYEVAYIVGKGDPANMYVKLDPDAKGKPPAGISDILARFGELDSMLDAANLSGNLASDKDKQFKCGPPDGVDLMKWLPAIFCWLASILPPTISAGSCTQNSAISDALAKANFGKDDNGNGIPDYQEDLDGNGLPASMEYVKDGEIVLTATPKKASYQSPVKLTATMKNAEGKTIVVDSMNSVSFDVARVVTYSGTVSNEVFRRGAAGNLGNGSRTKDYVNFSQISVRAKDGVASFDLSTKMKDADVYFDATVSPRDKNGKAAFVKVSEPFKLEIRSESIKVRMVSEKNETVSTFTRAGEHPSIKFEIRKNGKGGEIPLAFPVTASLLDDETGKNVADPVQLTDRDFTYAGALLKKAGNYRFEFTDKEGTFGYATLVVAPGVAKKIELVPSSNLIVKREKATVLARILDEYGNFAKGDLVKVKAEVSAAGFLVENSANSMETSTIEGYASFDVSGNDGGREITIKVSIPERNLSETVIIKTLDYAKAVVDVENRDSIVVGKEPHVVKFKIVDRGGATISDYRGIAGISFPEASGTFESDFIRIENGTSTGVLFTPAYVAGEKLSIGVNIPGVKDFDGNIINVNPDVPMKVVLSAEKSAMEARVGERQELTAKIFDRYGNIAYNHADGALSAKFEIPTEYKKYLKFPGGIYAFESKFNKGSASVAVEATKIPGTPYVTVEVAPGLEANSFTITDKEKKTLTIKGYSKNALSIETYYYWNRSKIEPTQYNALFTALIGPGFGNWFEKDYLAGELVFNEGSRSMAVVSLLNDASARERAVSFTPGGKLTVAEGDSLIKTEFGVSEGRPSVSFFDPFYRESVARAYLNVTSDFIRIACKWDGTRSLDTCEIPSGNVPYVILKGFEDANAISQNGLALVRGGTKIVEFDAFGGISTMPGVRLELDRGNTKNHFAAKVMSGNKEIGLIAMKFRADNVVLANRKNVREALDTNPGKIVIELISGKYEARSEYLGNTSRGAKGVSLHSLRSGEGEATDRDQVGGPERNGFEQFRDQQGIGWEGANKALLEFAAGTTAGNAIKNNSSFGTVVLGDPVVRVKKPKNEGAFDRTIGTKLLESNGEKIESYRKFDFNKDGYPDLVVFFETGKIRLFANYAGTLKDMGYLAYVADSGKRRKATGDFAGDGYHDIAIVTSKGQLALLDNQSGKFIRKEARIYDESKKIVFLKGQIVQLETYDMDADGKTDLVLSDDSGELNILYGTVAGSDYPGATAWDTVFVKKLVDDDLGLRLSKAERKDGGAAYFDTLPQLEAKSQKKYLEESASMAGTADTGDVSPEIKKAIIDSKIYYLHSYKVYNFHDQKASEEELENRATTGIGNDPENPDSPNAGLTNELLASMAAMKARAASGALNTTSTAYPETKYLSFIRSEFAEDQNVKVAKRYVDANGGVLQANDRVDIVIELTNTGDKPMNKFSYLDSFEKKLFKEGKDTSFKIAVGKKMTESDLLSEFLIDATDGGENRHFMTGSLIAMESSEYDYRFEEFDIMPGETATINYSLSALSVSFGKFFVGKIEKDDNYGDIGMKKSEVCGDAMTLWKTVDPRPRSYLKTAKLFPQGQNSSQWGLAGKYIDSNRNGQPDYIDVLAGMGDFHSLSSDKYDASAEGILLFRELPDPVDGSLNSGNIEVGKLVANAKTGFVQVSQSPGKNDVPVRLSASAVQGTYNDAAKLLSAGTLSNGAPEGRPLCWENGEKVYDAPVVQGWKQTMDPSKSSTQIYFSGVTGFHSADGGANKTPCIVRVSFSSDPKWESGGVVGLGWKILTKSSYNTYQLAAKKSNFNDVASNIPDNEDEWGDKLFKTDPATGQVMLDGLSESNTAEIEAGIDKMVQGLGCGFWGGACLSMPLNWAPLAPGAAPTVMGFPVWGLKTSTGFPLFSALTGIPVGPICVPTIWPVSPLDLSKSCGGIGAGGYLGDGSATNFFRFYLTPTLTGAMGAAACFGSMPSVSGKIPPQTVSPVVPGGNCIVGAKPLIGCKDDGSKDDGDSSVLGQGSLDNFGFVNANACKPKSEIRTMTAAERESLRSVVRGSLDATTVNRLFEAMPQTFGPHGLPHSPFVGIGGDGGEDPNFEVGIDTDALKNFDIGNIVKIKLDRVSGFPDFIMDWVNRQSEEIINKLTSLPALYIILPDFSKIYEKGWDKFPDALEKKFTEGSTGYKDKNFGSDAGAKVSSKYATWAADSVNSSLAAQSANINTVGKNISGVKAAYEFMSGLPIISFENETIPVSVPMISEEDIDKLIKDYKTTQKQWEKEIGEKKDSWSKLGTAQGANEQLFLDADGLVRSADGWIKFLEESKRFPDKLYKYLTWKQRYAEQLLCNIESIEQMTGGWIAENGKRFRAWVELIILLKAILKSWQLMVDLFYQHTNDCGVCRNERYDLKHFIFKIISAVIPKIPIIQFPKWPDIILDLHNVRLNLRVMMPEFDFSLSPFTFPKLPRLILPNVPTLGMSLPKLPPPPPFPVLPELPDLPSLPQIKLPDLPPPPKIPKLFSAIEGVLNILKLVSKILCILRKNPFVPEWRAGDQIAQITERQGKLKLDFFNVEFPNFPISFLDAIKVTTYVNVEFQIDFILEMAKATFQPVNELSTNFRETQYEMNRGFNSIVPQKIDGASVIEKETGVEIKDKKIDGDGVTIGEKRSGADFRNLFKKDPKTLNAEERKAVFVAFAYTVATSFKELLAHMESEKNEALTTTEFRQAISKEVAKLAGSDEAEIRTIAETLKRAAGYDGAEETALVKSLMSENTEKFKVAKDAIRAEIDEVLIMKAKISEGSGKKTPEIPKMLGLYDTPAMTAIAELPTIGTDFSVRGEALEKFADRPAEAYGRLTHPDSEKNELEVAGENLIGRVKELTKEGLAKERRLNDVFDPADLLGPDASLESYVPSSNSSSSESTAFSFDAEKETAKLAAESSGVSYGAGPSQMQPVFQGIYLQDEGVQTRLFDYTEELDGSEEPLLIDTNLSWEGKEDVVYRMGDALYFKRNLKGNDPAAYEGKIGKNSLDGFLSELLDNQALAPKEPTAPNYFHESFVSSNLISFSFEKAREADRKFRIEFYDYVDRFNRLSQGEIHEDASPKTPLRSIDLLSDLKAETVSDSKTEGIVVRKNVAYVKGGNGEAELTAFKRRILERGDKIGIAAGRFIHTGNNSASLMVKFENGGDSAKTTVLEVPENSNVEFLDSGEFEVRAGSVILFDPTKETVSVSISDLKGVPLMPETKIDILRKGGRLDIAYYDGSEHSVAGPSSYLVYDLGMPKERDEVSFSHSNDWYYSRLYAFGADSPSPLANQILLSPQLQADKEGPLVEFPMNYKIPVYLKDDINLKRYVRDNSLVADAYVDVNPSRDADRNGNPADDRDSDNAATASGFLRGPNWNDLTIGPFDEPKVIKAKLVTKDTVGNVTSKDLTVTVYVPTPEIQTASGTQAAGVTADLPRAGEPIDVFRHRAGSLKRLSTPTESVTDAAGNFLKAFTTGSGVVLKVQENGVEKSRILEVDEKTGTIQLKASGAKISVSGASASVPMTINVTDAAGKITYSQSFALPPNTRIEKISDFGPVKDLGIFVKPSSADVGFERNATDAPTLPGGGFITDVASKSAIAGISRDGNVYVMKDGLTLAYRNEGDRPVVVVKNASGVIIAEVLYRLNAEYIIK